MTCLDENAVVAFVEGRMDAGEVASVEAHVDGCADCLALVAAFARTRTVAPEAPPPADTDGAAPRAPRRGARIGRYVVERLVGMGGMGAVYAARDPDLERTVALKLVLPSGASDDAQLLREARTVAQLAHPNVVTVHDVGTFEGRVFLAMELVDGETLRAALGRDADARRVLSVFARAGRGLAAAHEAGVVHRDFKPENVLVGANGRVVVTDFGLACAGAALPDALQPDDARLELGAPPEGSASSRAGGAGSGAEPQHESRRDPAQGPSTNGRTRGAGTPAYMAPEQIRGRAVDARADQFAFCVALFEALNGARPFAGDSTDALLASIERGDVARAPWTGVPSRVRAAILRGLAASPDDRWPSMAPLLDAIDGAGRRRARRAAIAALGVAAVAAAFGGAVAIHRERTSCADAVPAKLAGTWDAPTKAAVARAFLAVDKPWARDTWSRVEAALDDHTTAWTRMHVDACDATHVRAEQSPELLDLRVACLSDRLAEMHALVDVLAHADAETVRRAPAAVAALTPLSRCSDTVALRSVAPPPPEKAPRVRAVSADLARVKALVDAGRAEAALKLAVAVAEQAAAIGYGPLEASAYYALGDAQVLAGDPAAADATLGRAARLADATGDDATRARASTRRLFVEGYVLRKGDRVEELDGEAEAAIARHGGDPTLEADRLHALGMSLLARGDLAAADGALARAAETRQRVWGPESRQVAMSTNGRCLVAERRGAFADALSACERALAIWQHVLGSEHPDFALGLNNVGALLERFERHDEACPYFERAVAVSESALGASHPQVAMALGNLGECALARGEAARAVALHARALAIREASLPPGDLKLAATLTNLGRARFAAGDVPGAREALERAATIEGDRGDPELRGETEFELARALWDGGGDRRRARDLARRAERELAASPAEARERRSLTAWLAAHP